MRTGKRKHRRGNESPCTEAVKGRAKTNTPWTESYWRRKERIWQEVEMERESPACGGPKKKPRNRKRNLSGKMRIDMKISHHRDHGA